MTTIQNQNNLAQMKHYTRLRAYSLSTEGASLSLSVNDKFTLIEGRYNDDNRLGINYEMNKAGVSRIDVLHITSWDEDHCNAGELRTLLRVLKPKCIEYPSYTPHTENGEEAKKLITGYTEGTAVPITPYKVNNCVKNRLYGSDVLFNPIENNPDPEKSNDNSVAKIFREGSFQVLSLGDCEDENISKRLRGEEIIQKEVDILILAHHGSTNSVVTPEFLDDVMPSFVICPVDRDNRFNHPDQEVRGWLNSRGIPYLTTKDGDVVIRTRDSHTYQVFQIKDSWIEQDCSPLTGKTYYLNDIY